uniref:WW domain-containing protein n=1 Tax=Caenorhabditis tropicalis TaxID=1561998 RepID=A0A1I7UIE9_9PELO
MNVNGPSKYNHLLAAQAAAAAQAAFFQQAFQLQQAAALNPPTSTTPNGGATSGASGAVQPTMRYYDPTSDGFFYEMASVDGWKRRQPNKPVSASVPNGVTRPYSQRQAAQTTVTGGGAPSYGAALARGQFPRNTVKQPEPCTTPADSRDSASSSQCGDTFELFSSNDPIFNPIQRPSALNLEQKAVGGAQQPPPPAASTVALFEAVLADFNGGVKPTTYADLLPTPATGAAPTTQSPMKESWNSFRSCSLFSPIKPSSKRVPTTVGGGGVASNQPMGGAATMLDEMDDDTMRMLLKDLDKLWANTPVSGLNQA